VSVPCTMKNMANTTNSHGSPLLALTTRRPPDSNRGSKIIHIELILPQNIASQVHLWETGGRGQINPSEAATWLWSSSVAQFLNGEIDAWLNVPGVKLLLPGLNALMTSDPTTWPDNQTKLRELVANKAPGAPDWDSLFHELKERSTIQLLNDLVLIFKFASIGKSRPLRKVAELYRLAYTLTNSIDAPNSREAVIAHLRAPLITPRVLSTSLGSAGPNLSTFDPTPRNPRGPIGTIAEPILESLNSELTRIESINRVKRIRNVLKGIGLKDNSSIAEVIKAIGDNTEEPLSTEQDNIATTISRTSPERTRPRLVSTRLFGAPLLIYVSEIESRIAHQRRELATRITETLPLTIRKRLEAAGVAIEDLRVWSHMVPAISSSPSYLEPMGRSDLLLVRQTTTGYRRSEIAYIENILIGETRNREHTNRIFNRRELFESTTRETEETHDLQITDRAELSREISKVINEDLKAQGNVEVTSRGPTKVVVSAGVSYNRSTEEAARSAEDYSRETIERAIKRTMERVTREARAVFEQEITELNKHGFTRDGNAEDHVSGIYQYLERVSHARMFWYGERELYEILIPEPAALIWQLATTRKEIHIPIEQPDEELFRSITLDNIASKREEIIRAFRVMDMPKYPVESPVVSTSFSASGSGKGAHYVSNKELQIPDGHIVTSALFQASVNNNEAADGEPNGGIIIGNEVNQWAMTLVHNSGSTAVPFEFVPPLPGPMISLAVDADDFRTFSGTITLNLKLTDTAQSDWALNAYGRVAERYEQLRREYEETVIQATAAQYPSTISLPEGARSQLKQIVRAELQRASIDVMRNTPVNFDMIDDFGFNYSDGTLGSHPVIDLNALRVSGPEIQFLQQAFEWEHLSWILYPYFWGRRTEWNGAVVVSHPDPDFAAFLNAGAARVQIPVRPGFEDLVKHFMETGEVYEGDGLPKMGDPGYVPFIDEQMTSLGAPGEEVPWPVDNPRQWDFVQPTSLVLVRSTQAQMPKWDPDTGAEI
jgi:hypothetical protein